MNQVAANIAKHLKLDFKVAETVTTYVYKPTDKEEKEDIMEGQYPYQLAVFLHALQATDGACMHDTSRWYKDPEGPYIEFDLREKG